ncbi:hypothetical protein TWF730_010180 [Orbilia blumenaviensis]|uniref:Uncharacterized protein n=1 Tax=Orbilia blumenaviensis TaxID=1796055 RepID=A0AAV9UMK5_9PEZI
MHISTRFNVLLFALIALVSFTTARTTITIQSCSTRYCGNPTKAIRTTKTVHKTTRYSVYRWKTSTKYRTTHTLTSTKYTTLTKYNTNTIRTVTIYTGKSTRIQTLVPSVYATEPQTWTFDRTVIITPTYTVPAPSGFIGVDNDPDNSASPDYTPLPAPQEPDRLKRDSARDAAAEVLEPRDPANRYAEAVTCTKTLLTKTGTMDVWMTTTKTLGVTTALVQKTVTINRTNTKTVTAKDARTIRTLSTKYSSVWGTSTQTIWTMQPVTISPTVTLTSEATATAYAACAINNVAPDWRPGQLVAANYGPAPGEKYIDIVGKTGTEECCVLCLNYSGPGKCLGTVWNFLGAEIPEEDCPDAFSGGVFMGWEFCPFDPDDHSMCRLIISDDEEGTCKTHTFEYVRHVVGKTRMKYVSNGPSCARYKYTVEGPSQP